MSYMDEHGKQRSLVSVGPDCGDFFRTRGIHPDIEISEPFGPDPEQRKEDHFRYMGDV
jgi:hypothetical protein